jgi:hypothetical protein|tara:strand:- start:703 stop:960 length:258 start_codon:yes stop_codon:yes gene_type:complete
VSDNIANSYNWRIKQYESIAEYLKSEILDGPLALEGDVWDWLLVLEDAVIKEGKNRDEVLEQIRTLDTVMSRHGVRSFEAQVLPA